MNQKLSLAFIALFTVACGAPDLHEIVAPQELKTHIDAFYSKMDSLGVSLIRGNLSASFASSSEFGKNVLAVCQSSRQDMTKSWPSREAMMQAHYNAVEDEEVTIIKVNEDYFKNASTTDQAITMYHELGHCLLGNLHENKYIPNTNNDYASLMHPYKSPRSKYEMYGPTYLAILAAGGNPDAFINELLAARDRALNSSSNNLAMIFFAEPETVPILIDEGHDEVERAPASLEEPQPDPHASEAPSEINEDGQVVYTYE